MLSSTEMVTEPSGKMKTLADMIKDGTILTPETPVHTSDDSEELKDYIESLIPAPTPNYSETKLFDNPNYQTTGNPAEIVLSEDVSNYDQIYFDVVRWVPSDNAVYSVPVILLSSQIKAGTIVSVLLEGKFVSYEFTDAKTMTRFNVSSSQNINMRGVYGIKY